MSDLSDASVEEGFADAIPPIALQKRKIFPVNNVRGLEDKLKDFRLNLDWIEKLDIKVDESTLVDLSGGPSDAAANTQAEHDFKREMLFYNQALASVTKAFKKLKKLGIPTKRPDDYFAEMAKSDVHMTKVREKLLSKQMVMERTEKIRAMREQKKQGKKIQREVIQQRKQEKKKMITALKKTKKGKMDVNQLLAETKQPPKMTSRKKKSREFRDSKYGYGGKKRGSKANTAESSAMYPGGGANKAGGKKGSSNKKSNFGKPRMKKHRRRR